jgi:hypothetical protein
LIQIHQVREVNVAGYFEPIINQMQSGGQQK